jgi:dTDP-4-amino-4,6-dideoxy-D-glucose ammonia-lyase
VEDSFDDRGSVKNLDFSIKKAKVLTINDDSSEKLTWTFLRVLQAITAADDIKTIPPTLLNILGSHLQQHLTVNGLNQDPLTLKIWVERAAIIIRLLSKKPFITLSELAVECSCSRAEAECLVASIVRDLDIRNFILQISNYSAYFRDTIQPIIDAGVVDAYRQGSYIYPFTVGLYPAVSCMLRCNFCARVTGEKYSTADIVSGNAHFYDLLAQAPTDNSRRFYISGGLEPLTNPGLGQLVHFASQRGFQMQLYTNAMMLTPHLLEQNQGLWDLGAIRISFYGADNATAERTTSRRGVATQVIANAKAFVKAKAERNAKIRLGFNHVIQTGAVGHLGDVAQTIVAIADRSPDRQGVNFLSLRENYAATGETAIAGDERQHLRDELVKLLDIFAAEGLTNLHVDMGYALQGLLNGHETSPLYRVSHDEVLGRGYPQVSVVVDLLGDVYLYREAAFIGREGANRYVIGRLGRDGSFEDILRNFIANRDLTVTPNAGDEIFLDAFDHTVTAFLQQVNDRAHASDQPISLADFMH